MTFVSREDPGVDALVTDRYLDALLAARDRGALDAPSEAELDPYVRTAARRLAADLTRVHPSFRFEERLAARLADLAGRTAIARAAGEPVGVTTGPILARDGGPASGRLDRLDLTLIARDAAGGSQRRPLLIGGTLASAAISIAGAAIVAWRLSRPTGDPITRAVRAAHERADGVRLA